MEVLRMAARSRLALDCETVSSRKRRQKHLLWLVILLFVAGSSSAAAVERGDSDSTYFVIVASFTTQEEAQRRAALGTQEWVLDTDLYTALAPDMFAVVQGPFASLQVAEDRAARLRNYAGWRDSYVKEAGKPSDALLTIANGLPPAVVAAFLGEMRLELTQRAGTNDGCGPYESHTAVHLAYMDKEREWNTETTRIVGAKAAPREVDLFLWMSSRTGAVERLRGCWE